MEIYTLGRPRPLHDNRASKWDRALIRRTGKAVQQDTRRSLARAYLENGYAEEGQGNAENIKIILRAVKLYEEWCSSLW